MQINKKYIKYNKYNINTIPCMDLPAQYRVSDTDKSLF